MKKQSAGRRVRREKIRRKKMQVREKVGKSRNTVFFHGFVAPEGWKVGSLKRRVRRYLGRWEMKSCTPLWREARLEVKCVKNWGFGPLLEVEMLKKCTPLWREARFQVKMRKTHQHRATFGSWDVEKSARRCGAKQISKSKCTKHTILGPLLEVEMFKKCAPLRREAHFQVKMHKKHQGFGPLLEVEMSKKCTPLWREAHVEVKMYKTHHSRTTFGSWDVEKVHAVVARSTFRSQNVKTPRVWTTFGGSDVASLHYTTHYTTLHSTTLHSTTLHYKTQHYNYNYTTTLHYTLLH